MPEILIGRTRHTIGRLRCTDEPQDECSNDVNVNPMTGLAARLSTKAGLPQTTGSAFLVGRRQLNEKTNGHVKGRRLIPGFNNK